MPGFDHLDVAGLLAGLQTMPVARDDEPGRSTARSGVEGDGHRRSSLARTEHDRATLRNLSRGDVQALAGARGIYGALECVESDAHLRPGTLPDIGVEPERHVIPPDGPQRDHAIDTIGQYFA
jgi:hypothetical protein